MTDHRGSDANLEQPQSNVIQLALFGDPVPVFDEAPRAKLTEQQEADAQQVLDAVAEWDQQLDLLLDGFPDEERAQAQRKLYLLPDGSPATRHGMLRAV